MEEEHPFISLVKSGKIQFREGKIIGFNEYAVFLPVRVLNKLYVLLRTKLGEKEAIYFLREMGKFQIKQALKRYLRILEWKQLEKQKIIQFAFNFLTKTVGWGNYQLEKGKRGEFIIRTNKSPFAEEFLLEYSKQKNPIDHYIEGGWEQFFTSLMGKPMVCEEVKCYAKGDDCCEFVVRPKEETEEEKK